MPVPTPHLLLVEDDHAWRDHVEGAARQEGFVVSHAVDGLDALDWLRSQPRPRHPDVILLDLVLPRMDGWELYGRLRTDTTLQHLNVLMMSEALHGAEAPLGGVVGYLRKTDRPAEALDELRSRLRRLPESPAPAATPTTYALRVPEGESAQLRSLPPPLRSAVRTHLLRAAELTSTELPMASTWLMALPGEPTSLLVSVEGVRVVLEVDDVARTLTATAVLIPAWLRHAS